MLIKISSDTLSRLERLVCEVKRDGIDQLTAATKTITLNQDSIKEKIQDSSQDLKLDTARLIGICIGIATGVQRLTSIISACRSRPVFTI